MDISQRFNILDGVAQLVPFSSQPCSQCCVHDSWSDDIFLSQENYIVTLQRCIPAKGIFVTNNYIAFEYFVFHILYSVLHEAVFWRLK